MAGYGPNHGRAPNARAHRATLRCVGALATRNRVRRASAVTPSGWASVMPVTSPSPSPGDARPGERR